MEEAVVPGFLQEEGIRLLFSGGKGGVTVIELDARAEYVGLKQDYADELCVLGRALYVASGSNKALQT